MLINTITIIIFLLINLFFLQKLQQKEDFTLEQIDKVQYINDVFFVKWLDFVRYGGLTNYIHMLGAGQIQYYLVKWKKIE
jgi:hypothetical protein